MKFFNYFHHLLIAWWQLYALETCMPSFPLTLLKTFGLIFLNSPLPKIAARNLMMKVFHIPVSADFCL